MMGSLVGRKMTGRCANGAEKNRGTRVHMVSGPGGSRDLALCRARPGRQSGGWSHDTYPATCDRCLRQQRALQARAEAGSAPALTTAQQSEFDGDNALLAAEGEELLTPAEYLSCRAEDAQELTAMRLRLSNISERLEELAASFEAVGAMPSLDRGERAAFVACATGVRKLKEEL
jgi:hypothetical protein